MTRTVAMLIQDIIGNGKPCTKKDWAVISNELAEALKPSHNTARDEICAAWLPNEAACAYWGACNCAETPCRNTRKLSPVA